MKKPGELLSFQDVMNKTNNPSLLLGNGFSMAYDQERFSFTSLLNSAVESGIISKDSSVYKVFKKLETADFESVMKSLDHSEQIVGIYEKDGKIGKNIRKDSQNLKKYLAEIVTHNHPSKCTEISDLEKQACLDFLGKFRLIYTLNYDLLMYWSTMIEKPSLSFTDGFSENEESFQEGYVVYGQGHGFRVHYLHGGLHIFDAGSEIIKKTYSKTGVPLVDQIKENLENNIYPIFISEGTHKQKLAKILHNSYLNSCYKSFRNANGDLVIFGTCLKSNDEHILQSIIDGKFKRIYLGVSKESSADKIKTKINEYNKSLPDKSRKRLKKELFLYDYKTVNVWGRKQQ